jgi:hypothetical protein
VWWGKPLLLLIAGTYAYWLLGLAAFIVANHHLLLQDTPRLIAPMLAAAGVLTIAHAAPGIVRRLSIRTVPSGLGTLSLCLLSIFVAITAWQGWMPGGPTPVGGLYQPAVSTAKNDATLAFTNPLPDGRYPAAAPAGIRQPWFPTDPIKKDVASVLGASAAPVTLSASEELSAFVNWPGYIGVYVTAAGIDTNWSARYAALRKLSGVTDPAAFAAAAAHTAFGPIDVFILVRTGPAQWSWTPAVTPDGAVTFTPAQFSPAAFTVFTNLNGGYVLAVRKPQGNG